MGTHHLQLNYTIALYSNSNTTQYKLYACLHKVHLKSLVAGKFRIQKHYQYQISIWAFPVKFCIQCVLLVVLRHLGYFLNRVPTALHRSGTGVPI